MLDIKFIRANVDLVKEAARKKKMNVDIDLLITLDDQRIELVQKIESMRASQNEASILITNSSDDSEKARLIAEMKELKPQIQKLEEEQKEIMSQWKEIMYQVPNVPDATVPDGDSDEDNQEVFTWGEKPDFEAMGFEPKSHDELLKNLDLVDFERGAKVHGFRGYFLKGDLAMLSWAIWNYARDFFIERGGFIPVLAPAVVREEHFYGTGHLPNETEDIFKTQDNDYLAGTAEVPVMGYHSNEILDEKDFPVKYFGFTPCYRREAGSHGKDTKGLYRVHEFYKWEQVILCKADHEESVEWHEWLTDNTEAFIQSLNIPYRKVMNCGGDLGQGQVKKYDIELWSPVMKKYREIASSSYFHDFQTRRFNIRYRDGEGSVKFAHSLNNTAIATPRLFVTLAENYQNEDGTIRVPEVLVPYMKKDTLGKV